jgi:hypothetical protein
MARWQGDIKQRRLTRYTGSRKFIFYRGEYLSKDFRKNEYGEVEYNQYNRHKTFAAFIEDITCSGNNSHVSKVLENISKQQEPDMVF